MVEGRGYLGLEEYVTAGVVNPCDQGEKRGGERGIEGRGLVTAATGHHVTNR